MRSWRLDLQYDGSAFHGWAGQPGLRTVQGELERTLSTVLREAVRVRVAGRTDAGVHAWGQVASFATADAADAPQPRRLLLALNALLPEDVAVTAVSPAAPGFDARAAASRTYRYQVWLGAARPVRERRYVWHVRAGLDTAALADAAALFVGHRDWAACTPSARLYHTCVRDVLAAGWHCAGAGPFDAAAPPLHPAPGALADAAALPLHPAPAALADAAALGGSGGLPAEPLLLTFQITATGFLHNMVRVIVGTMVDVAQGRMTRAAVETALRRGERRAMGQTAPARGLALVRVEY